MQAIIYDMEKNWLPATENKPLSHFEETYIGLRRKENRIYTDKELALLPLIARDHPHFREWKMRQSSCKRLKAYLEKKTKPLRILDVGCGNGWLSNQLAAIPETFITGIDINQFELHQAKQVFSNVAGLRFTDGSIDTDKLQEKEFDIIVFAASIQYFESFPSTIQQAIRLLKPGGEIHIFDSHFYKIHEVEPAIQRTNEYYLSMGFPEMADQYFHHCIHELNSFRHHFLYKTTSPLSFLRPNRNPFPWVCIKMQESCL